MKNISKMDLSLSPAKRALLDKLMRGEGLAQDAPQGIPARAERGRAPLSFAQRRLWFIDQLEPGNPVYNNHFAFRLRGALDLRALQLSLDEIVGRHESLRTTFRVEGAEPVQVIAPSLKLDVDVLDVEGDEGAESDEPDEAAARLAAEEARRPFDLERGPLLRLTLLRVAGGDDFLLFTIHHIISDGWSLGVFVEELTSLYRAFSAGGASPLAPLRVQYGDFAAWHRGWLDANVRAAQLPYWKEKLAGAAQTLDLPLDHPRPSAQGFRGAAEPLRLTPELSDRLREYSRQTGHTLFVTVLAAFKALLYRYTGQQDILVGTPVAGRVRAETEPLISFFADTLVLRDEVSGASSFAELTARVGETTVSALANQDVPFDLLVEELNPERGLGRNPLFQVAFALHKGQTHELSLPGVTLRRFEVDAGTSKFDLTLDLVDGGRELAGAFEYNSELFDAQTVRRMAGHFVNLLESAVGSPQQRIRDLRLLSDAERRLLEFGWNDTRVEHEGADCVHRLVERQAEETPDAVAVSSADGALTYRELNARANQLAHRLLALGVGAEKTVCLCLERSPEFSLAALAVLKAGGAYVPLDPAYPRERLAYMVRDSGAGVLLTSGRLGELFEDDDAVVKICLDADWADVARGARHNPASRVTPRNLAYVIYTSGSTGQAKGVAVEHAGLANLVRWHQRVYGLGRADRTSQIAGLGFDASVWEMWPTLACGASLRLPDAETRNSPEKLRDWLLAEAVTVSFMPTPLAEAMLALSWPRRASLRAMLTGGDRLRVYPSPELPFTLHNHYGPTESTVLATATPVRAEDGREGHPSIGRPVDNTRVYLSDAHFNLVPVGTPGEIHIAGVGLARGYLNSPELTAESYVPNPHGGAAGERLYKTGDLARRTQQGEIEFLRRADRQIKIRGFRVELQETEFALRRHEDVDDAVVVYDESRPARGQLVAYVVFGTGARTSDAELKDFLKKSLPEYMVPSAFVVLERMPLTPNGKVDRRALPAPEAHGAADAAGRPLEPLEEIVAGVWCEVLGVERVGAGDNFFDLGGHSLLATQVAAKIRDKMGVELPLRTLFETHTLADLAASVESLRQARSGDARATRTVTRAGRGGEAPLSFAQQRLWFIDQLEPGTAAYNIPAAVRLAGRLDAQALRRSLSEVVRRHESLRTRFASRSGRPVQVVDEYAALALPVIDLGGLEPGERDRLVAELAREEAGRGFDLTRSPLLRAALLRLSGEEHVLLLTMHHIVSDGWSVSVIVGELTRLYAAFSAGGRSPLEELPLQYADYAAWERERVEGGAEDEHLAYWRGELEGVEVLELPTDRPRPAAQSYRGASESFSLGAGLARSLRELSRREGVTLYMTLLAGFQLLLSRYSGQGDVAVGSPVAGRTQAELEGVVGFFVNTVVMRGRLYGEQTVGGLLAGTREAALGGYEHQRVSFGRLVEELAPGRSLSHQPLFQVMFALQENHLKNLKLEGLDFSHLDLGTETSQFDLTLSAREEADDIACSITYATQLFDAGTIRRLGAHYRRLLEGMAADSHARVMDLPLLGEDEAEQILVGFNSTDAVYDEPECVHQLFERQAERTPDTTALVYDGRHLTYGELNRRANQLAHRLRELGVGPESRVALCMERSVEMVVALLGVLKAGGAYVPVDPTYPRERIDYMVRDAAARVVLTQQHLAERVGGTGLTVLCLDSEWEQMARLSVDNCESSVGGGNLMYAIYTSGSTGQPKGAMNTHAAVRNRLLWMQSEYGLDETDRVLQKTPYTFDVSGWEFFWPLLAGSRLVVARPEGHRDCDYLNEVIRAEGITTLHFVPPMLRTWLSYGGAEKCTTLKRVFCSGEALDAESVEKFNALLSAELHNLYGPTEAAIDVTYWYCRPDWDEAVVPIGRPIANTQIYVLDARLRPAPLGVVGELYIGGDGLARGYLDRPDLTAERFVADPFSSEPGERLYRTGDLARLRADGEVEYVGRADHQVKVRGYRIELGEVEAVLSECEGVEQAAAAVREDARGERRLVAYVSGAPGGRKLSASVLREEVSGKVPEYMVPSAFVVLEEMPLTGSGKIDRKSLPEPKPEGGDGRGEQYVAPRGELEGVLCGIWEEVLGVERVGVFDNFFHVGGHSLLATQVVARVRSVLGVEVSLRTIFADPTVAAMSLEIQRSRQAGNEVGSQPVARAGRGGEAPLSFAQQQLWLVDQLEPGTAAYNIPAAVRLAGRLDAQALRRSLSEVVRRHESLRTRFASRSGRPVQVVDEYAALALPVIDLGGLEPGERDRLVAELAREEAGRGFDLTRSPLLRAALLRLSGEEHVLLLTMHHIVSDGWSVSVIVGELTRLYESFRSGGDSPLPELALQYADYAVWEREQAEGDEGLEYWRGELEGVEVLELPTDRPRPAAQSYRGASESFSLGAGLARSLRELSRREGVTLYMTLLAGFQLLLSRYSGQGDVAVGSPVAGRTQAELEGVVGFFVNTVVMRGRLYGEQTVGGLLAGTREAALGGYEHQRVSFGRLVEELAPGRSLSHQPLFQVWFVLQNVPTEKVSLPGLTVETMPIEDSFSKFDLMLSVDESDEALPGTLRYKTDLFDAGTVRRMLTHYRRLLEGMAADSQSRVMDLPLMDEDEAGQILSRLNDTATPYDEHACFHQLFERQAERTPDSTALVYEGQHLSYGELNRRANRLAHYLRELGVGPESRVALCMERGVEMVIGLLGVLKAGGAYVPVDPAYPRERVGYVLEDAAARVVLTQQHLAERVGGLGAAVVRVDGDWEQIGMRGAGNCVSSVSGENLVYVIYTSGSTGQPKGVGVTHRGLTNYLTWSTSACLEPGTGQCPVHSSLSFDLLLTGLFTPLLTGHSLALLPNAEELDALATGLTQNRYRLLKLTPSHLKALSYLVKDKMPADADVCFVVGGEALTYEDLAFWRSAAPSTRLINHYGPTETVIGRCTHEVLSHENGSGAVPIGKPIANTQIYVLDARLRPAPLGVVGELYIGGDGLARGYLDRPDLTAERFVADPFSSEPGERLYRTGDLARLRADGEVEYVGRADHQVKVRGYRIELGEVEAVLSECGGVEQAAAAVREDARGERRLVAYVSGAPGAAKPSVATLREQLGARVPEYLVPSQLVVLERMPLTGNGKIDRKRLPEPEADAAGDESKYVAPRSATEGVLCGIWEEVLGVERVGVFDNFFELGGDSILSIQVVARAREEGIQLTPRHFFEHQTVAQLAEVAAQAAQARRQDAPAVPDVSAQTVSAELTALKAGDPQIEDLYPLSPMQQGMLFHSLYAPDSGVYFDQLICTFRGELDVEAFRRAWQQLVDHHAVLRTAFLWERMDEPVQVVRRQAELPWDERDWRDVPAARQREELEAFLKADQERGVELARAPLMRLCLIRTSEDDYRLVWSRHHLLLDGWSTAVLLKQVFDCYEALAGGSAAQLETARPFKDYIEWLGRQDKSEAERFWREALKGHEAATPLGIDRAKPAPPAAEAYGKREIRLSEESTAGLKELGRRHQITLNTVIQGAWALLLSRYSGESKVMFGTTVAGRPAELPGVEQMVGLFINTVPLGVEVEEDEAVAVWLKRVQQQHAAVRQFEHSPLVEIQGWSDVPRGTPLFESLFVFENYPVDASLTGDRRGGLEVQGVRNSEQTNYPVTLVAVPSARLTLRINYRRERFEDEAVGKMLGHLRRLLESIVADAEQPVARLDPLDEAERRDLLRVSNDDAAGHASGLCIHELFERQVERTPDADALTYERQSISYGELNRRANRLAHHLRGLGVGPESRVAVCMERSPEMVVALFGVLKAGGAYVPLDPAYPQERIDYMVRDAAAVVVLTQSHLLERLPGDGAPVLALDADCPRLARSPETNPEAVAAPGNLAYIIYTSGSTGAPKGVMVTHANVARLFDATRHWFDFGPRDVWSLFHSYAFDFSVWEIYGALLYGGRLVVVPYWVSRSSEAFHRLLCDERVTVLNQTPSAFQQLMRAEEAAGAARESALRLVIFGGEALELQSLKPWFERHGDERPRLVNMYGITETTVHVTYRPLCEADARPGASSVVGRPIPDLQVYVLDGRQRLVPAGVAGEMYVGGAGVARGYLNRPGLTAQRFIPHPFGAEPGATLYRTGDVARWNEAGELEYLGRNDAQVKVRGFRIETGEIEAALLEREEVGQAVVLVREEEGRGKQLAAFVVASNGVEPDSRELRGYLQGRLPEYMVPASIAVVGRVPLTSNGKLDRRALLSLKAESEAREGEYEAARNEVEGLLAQVWQEVLGVERVGVNDNFFELGGDSILSIQIVARAGRAGVPIQVQQIFQYQTVAELARVAVMAERAEAGQDEAAGEVPLTPIQRRFFELGLPNVNHYNQSVLLELDSRPAPAPLSAALGKLVEHHDALRLRFTETEEGWRQSYADSEHHELVSFVDLSHLSGDEQRRQLEERAASAQASLDITDGPLLRAVLFDMGEGRGSRLLLAVHHLAVDGVSWRILLEDLQSAFSQARGGQGIELPARTSSFKRWAEGLQRYAASEELRAEADYWLDDRRGHVAALPVDFAGGENTVGTARSVEVTLSREETQALLQEVPRAYHTQVQEVLATALALAVCRWADDTRVLVDMEGHGREEVVEGADVSRTVGWFTSLYPVLLEVGGGGDLASTLKGVKEQLRGVPGRGVGYGVLKYLGADEGLREGLRGMPAAEVSFNYLGQFDQLLGGSEFRAAAESTGAVQDACGVRPHLLALNGMVVDGRLRMTWGYSESLHRRESVESVAGEFLEVLREIVEHCRGEEAGGFTPSDFPLANLDQDSLDSLLRDFDAF